MPQRIRWHEVYVGGSVRAYVWPAPTTDGFWAGAKVVPTLTNNHIKAYKQRESRARITILTTERQ